MLNGQLMTAWNSVEEMAPAALDSLQVRADTISKKLNRYYIITLRASPFSRIRPTVHAGLYPTCHLVFSFSARWPILYSQLTSQSMVRSASSSTTSIDYPLLDTTSVHIRSINSSSSSLNYRTSFPIDDRLCLYRIRFPDPVNLNLQTSLHKLPLSSTVFATLCHPIRLHNHYPNDATCFFLPFHYIAVY